MATISKRRRRKPKGPRGHSTLKGARKRRPSRRKRLARNGPRGG